ncbi:hypothetical protein A9Q99_08440 [Gammaproteobacteria bacterium 45_16_T64]|nr:hypothetical protein A9Q99_08440 [Gammaproteobacteria bacterium 45_16_T64]
MINNDASSINVRTLTPDKTVVAAPVKDVPDVPVDQVVSNVDSGQPAQGKSTTTDDSSGGLRTEQSVKAPPDPEELKEEELNQVSEAIVHVEEYMQDNQRTLNFEMAEKDNRVIITVIDQETKEIIRQIPPEDIVKLSDAIRSGDLLESSGILIQSKA